MGFSGQRGHKTGSILIRSTVTFIFKFVYSKICLTNIYWAFLCEKYHARCWRLEEEKITQRWVRHYHCLQKRLEWGGRHIWRPGQNRRVGRDGAEWEQIPNGTMDAGLSVTLTLLQGQDGESWTFSYNSNDSSTDNTTFNGCTAVHHTVYRNLLNQSHVIRHLACFQLLDVLGAMLAYFLRINS